jgi:hypothetical protein
MNGGHSNQVRRTVAPRCARLGGGGQGRGRRDTALRSARALTDSPISASSAAACAAVPRRWRLLGGSGRDAGGVEDGVGGTPGGWAGWRRRSGRRRAAARGRAGGLAGAAAGCATEALAGAPAGCATELLAGAGAGRLSLRRCGRRCGSEPRTSDGRSSVKDYMMAHRGDLRRTGRLIMRRRRRS